MTIAAAQCQQYLEARYPGILISRKSCRDTAGGSISQHSAYGITPSDPTGYYSNAMDIFGPGKTSSASDQAYIDGVVRDLLRHEKDWSIRKIIWRDGGAHENHAHVDFYPMIREHRWCNRDIEPVWRYSDGITVQTRDPEPEAGRFTGEWGMPREQWEQMIDALFEGRPDQFRGNPNYWKFDVPAHDEEWEDFWNAFVRAISLT